VTCLDESSLANARSEGEGSLVELQVIVFLREAVQHADQVIGNLHSLVLVVVFLFLVLVVVFLADLGHFQRVLLFGSTPTGPNPYSTALVLSQKKSFGNEMVTKDAQSLHDAGAADTVASGGVGSVLQVPALQVDHAQTPSPSCGARTPPAALEQQEPSEWKNGINSHDKEACERHISRAAEDVEIALPLVRHRAQTTSGGADELEEQSKLVEQVKAAPVGIGVPVWLRFLPALILYPIWFRTMVALDLWEPAYRDGTNSGKSHL
jgi:hypothetical protein